MLDTLQNALKQAMKDKNIVTRDILRFVISQIKNKEIDTQKSLTDDEIIKIIKKEVKQIDEVIINLTDWSDELAIENEKKEILGAYLPEVMSKDQLAPLVQSKITELGIDNPKQNRGPIIWALMWEHWSAIDGSMLNEIINSF